MPTSKQYAQYTLHTIHERLHCLYLQDKERATRKEVRRFMQVLLRCWREKYGEELWPCLFVQLLSPTRSAPLMHLSTHDFENMGKTGLSREALWDDEKSSELGLLTQLHNNSSLPWQYIIYRQSK